MRLGIVTTSFRPYQWYSGISNAVYLLAKGLNERHGIRPIIYMPRYDGMKEREEHESFTIERFKTINLNTWRGYYFSIDAFRKISSWKPDILHSFHYGYFPATAGFVEARRNGVPHIFTAAYHNPSSFINKKLLGIYGITQGARIIKKSNFTLPFNKNERAQLQAISSGRFKIVPCPINSSIFRPKDSRDGRLTVTYVGPMETWKGAHIAFDLFTQIAKERKDVDFIFVGNGPLKHQIEMYKKFKGIADKRIHFTRELTSQQLSGVYNRSDVLVSPTMYESFGCVLAESMMCGTPVVSTRVGAVPETVGSGGMLTKYGDWKGMKNNIITLLDDSSLRKRLSRNALKHSGQYKDSLVVEKTLGIYKAAMGGAH